MFFNAAARIQCNVFRVSCLVLEPRLRAIFNQKRVNSIVRSLESLSYEEGLIELKICSGGGKTGVRKTG